LVILKLPPIVKNLSLDPDLAAVDVRVFLVASQLLPGTDFTRLPLVAVSLPLGLNNSTVARSLRRLCEQGYLERGPRAWNGGPIMYRVTPGLLALVA
jgi:hypothetical protein